MWEERMKYRIVALAGLVLTTFAPAAWALGKGSSMFAIELIHGTGDYADKLTFGSSGGPASYITAYEHSEGGFQGQYWYMLSEDYALTVTAGYGSFWETDKPGQGASAGSPELEFTTSSFNLRLGGDRVGTLGERTIMYGGPGIEYWSGSATFKPDPFASTPSGEYKNESTTRISLSARIGATMLIGTGWGLTTHVGGRYGWASTEEDGAKASWTPSSVEASAGVIFVFGGQ
jgi:hypothetical protein